MSKLFKIVTHHAPAADFLQPANVDRLRSLLAMLGASSGSTAVPGHNGLLALYRKGMAELAKVRPDLPGAIEAAVLENWQLLPVFKYIPTSPGTASYLNNLSIPKWLLVHLCE
jgi:hypothetical protein